MFRKAFLMLAMLISVLFFCSSENNISGAKAEPAKFSEKTIQEVKIASTLQDAPKAETYSREVQSVVDKSGMLDNSPIGDIVKTLWENDVYVTLGSGPCLEDDSEVGNDYLPQLVFEDSEGCHRLIDFTLGNLTKYKYLLILLEGKVMPDAYPFAYSYAVGSGMISEEYSLIALELPEEDCLDTSPCPLTDNLGGFPSSYSYRNYVLGYISDLLSVELRSTEDQSSPFEDQFIGAIAANENMVNVLLEEGYLIP